jgi:hypothetical protein
MMQPGGMMQALGVSENGDDSHDPASLWLELKRAHDEEYQKAALNYEMRAREIVNSWLGKNGCAPGVQKLAAELHAKLSVLETGMSDIKKEVIEWRTDYREVQGARARLEKMQSEGLMKFTAKVDPKSFWVLRVILARGDVAKAKKDLKMADSTIRDIVRGWKGKTGPYAVMHDLVRWRKKIGARRTVPFNENLLYEFLVSGASNESVFSELLDGILSMTESNWPDVCAELELILKQHLGR